LFDAINFFEQIEPRLVAKDGPIQVWKDANHGHRYFLRVGDTDITLVADPIRNNVVSAPDAAGADHLITLPAATSPALGESRLAMIEAYPGMYIEMRDQ
jgi:hypothetical protein